MKLNCLKIFREFLNFQTSMNDCEQLPTSYGRNWPISYDSRRATARNFQLDGNNSETIQDIDLEFSALAHYMSGVN